MPANLPLIYGYPSLLDRLMDETGKPVLPVPEEIGARHFPPLQIIEDDEALYVRATLPGLTDKHVRLSIQATTLTISGMVPLLPGRNLRRDRPAGPFRRDVRLPFHADMDAVRAAMSNGILTITLPKHISMKKRSIPVNVAYENMP